ncbi:bactofilin family protein [Amorphus orientalis]|uniref:Cytoskeletal protein CcmA (Bactofilin family) n=1 Tax=Amorphus orientalis TaxID=649198 RepID=A0AAE3VNW7_9HYPH|nr:polymer-forming cytoskeletal protein [Amorphus orientalis]MDQ0315126.1 cytoskeletal protein CcmA (bactofilin family) [Amorphus orientalis]
MSVNDDIEFIVGPGTVVSGASIRVKGTALISGRFEGDLSADRTIIAATGVFAGTLSGSRLELHGGFDGDASLGEQALLGASARFSGTLSYRQLVVESGARLVGAVAPLDEAGQLEPLLRQPSEPSDDPPASNPPDAAPEPEPAGEPDADRPSETPRAASGSKPRQSANRTTGKPKSAASAKTATGRRSRTGSRKTADAPSGGKPKT